jgi:nucleoside-diphosphate-sugar epimerase
MNLFVTGGTGFIGSHFLRAALAAGHRVIALRRPGSVPRIPLVVEPEWLDGALDSVAPEALRGCDALVHLAALGVSPQKAEWAELFRVNVSESLALWQRAVDAGVRQFLVCGSCFEYGQSGSRYATIPPDAPLEPVNGYGASKAAASVAVLALAVERGLSLSLLRPFHVFGEGQHRENFWPSLRAAALAGKDFPMTSGEQVRDFVPVERVAARFLAALADPPPAGRPRIANIGTGQPQTLRAFAEEWWGRFGATGRLQPGAVPYRAGEVMRYVPELSSS